MILTGKLVCRRPPVPVRREDHPADRRGGLLPLPDHPQLRPVRLLLHERGHPVRGPGRRQGGDDHRGGQVHGPPGGRVGQLQPAHLERGRLRHVHGHHGQRGHLRGEREDADRQLRDRQHGPPAHGGVGEGPLKDSLSFCTTEDTLALQRLRLYMRTGTCSVLHTLLHQQPPPHPSLSPAEFVRLKY